MATRPPIKPHPASFENRPLTIWGATSLLDDYFEGLEPSEASEREVQTISFGGSTVNRYPGDPGFSRGGGDRRVVFEQEKRGNATPGRRFWCERPTGTKENRRSNARQFTFEGNWSDLKDFARANRTGAKFTLRGPSGGSIEVGPAVLPN